MQPSVIFSLRAMVLINVDLNLFPMSPVFKNGRISGIIV